MAVLGIGTIMGPALGGWLTYDYSCYTKSLGPCDITAFAAQ
jgi:hypothetical protein